MSDDNFNANEFSGSEDDDTVIFLEEEQEEQPEQSSSKKKVKFNKPKRKYVKSSWVWKHFNTSSDGKYNICQVIIMNLKNEEVRCGRQFLNDGATGNMANHLRGKHNIQEKINKVMLYFIYNYYS
jgi:hypothetical protein